ncbi:protein-L-isoaspartate O-methyltransferase family protein [Sneathiella sp. HT1-7]|uniref:protein-L-isoaspartate O-methyltransferase family protein n=1 Tax=Sneathiella sp. HT1-7 TaxID=2887192 RepID=UPI001D13B351|nr:protein-L-isoaspartate O-methyltransferase [Sneathiella sp. HT1-7]MCC3304970.1 protein-L-isoaspartate O-methyltransferase [Sneathiella sp. HT1-7]
MISEKFAEARHHMVLSQLRPNRVTNDRVAEAMDTVPREEFVPKELRGVAYLDEDLEVAPGRFIVEPRVFGRLLQEADIQSTDVVLDIGCGTGYSSAVLGFLAQAVVAIESDPALVETASETLSRLECDNVAVVEGALVDGNAKQGPYNVIHINGAISSAPQSLLDQLAEGGRLVCVLGSNPGVATIYRRQGDRFFPRAAFDASVPALPDLMSATSFEF